MRKRRVSGFVDPARPLDWSHPLNRGLVADYTIIPNGGWRGGLTLRDLVRGGGVAKDGTLTNGAFFAGANGRTGGFGSVFLDGSNDLVALGTPTLLNITGAISIFAWINLVSIPGVSRIFDKNAATGSGYEFLLNGNSVSQSLGWSVNNSTVFSTAANVVALGRWQHIGVTVDASANTVFFVNGASVNSQATAIPTSSSNAATIGNRAAADRALSGNIDAVQVFNRSIGVGEVWKLYLESRRGNPERFRWVRGTGYAIPAAAATQNDDQRRILIAA